MDAPPPYSEISQDHSRSASSSFHTETLPPTYSLGLAGSQNTGQRPGIPDSGSCSHTGPSSTSIKRSSSAGPSSSSETRFSSAGPSGHSKARRLSCSSEKSSSSSSSSYSSASSHSSQSDRCRGKRRASSSVEQKENNKALKWTQPLWQGKRFFLQTKNAMVNVSGSLEARRSIQLLSVNGAVQWTGKSMNATNIKMHTANATVGLSGGNISVKRDLDIKTSNARLLFDTTALIAKNISVVTSNAEIRVLHAQPTRSLVVKTSNAPLRLFVKPSERRSGRKINIEVATSNAPIIVHMPSNFAGEFKLTTSKNRAVTIEDRQDAIVYNNDKKGNDREGHRIKKHGGSLKVTTSNNDITVVFDQ
ncbi:hypothetical protein BC941DRAFT_470342 [Chlamydoabsidia padenii]|nr:hypothetical protein BC941DRAFT_470342 [Chlamydoabsidia padenii]